MDINIIKNILSVAVKASLTAGKDILEIYQTADFGIEMKGDNSPLTLADKKAHRTIVDFLQKTDIPVLSEEGRNIAYEERSNWDYFWLVDPLDGTKEFIKKNGEFTVNIALINNGIPVAGVIYVPVLEDLYFGIENLGAFKIEKIAIENESNFSINKLIERADKLPKNIKKEKYTVVGSRSHMSAETEEFINELKKTNGDIEMISKGSSLKLCMVAEGFADIYPRFAPTMEWDTAAGHSICIAAGFLVTKQDGKTLLKYNKENLLNPWFIVKPNG